MWLKPWMISTKRLKKGRSFLSSTPAKKKYSSIWHLSLLINMYRRSCKNITMQQCPLLIKCSGNKEEGGQKLTSTSFSCTLVWNCFPNTNEWSPALSFSAKAMMMLRSPSTFRSRSDFRLRRDRNGFFPFCLWAERGRGITTDEARWAGAQGFALASRWAAAVRRETPRHATMNYVCWRRMEIEHKQSCQATCKIVCP